MQYLISYDMNGPLTRTDTSDLVPHDGVKEVFESLPYDDEDVAFAINSGYDIDTLRHFRDDVLEQSDLHLIGEMGSVYENDGDLTQVFEDEPEDDLLAIKQQLYEQAARDERKIHEQGNYSTTVGCTRIEAEGSASDPRGELNAHHAFDPDTRTEDIYASLETEHFDYTDEMVTFDPADMDAVKELADTLRHEHTFSGVRFTETNDGIGFYRDPDDADLDLEDAHEFMETVLAETGWDYQHNPDWGTDYMKDLELSKQHGAAELADELFDGPVTVIHVGDKPGDVMNGGDSFYAIEGSEAEKYCIKNEVPHETVSDGVEFTQQVLDDIRDS